MSKEAIKQEQGEPVVINDEVIFQVLNGCSYDQKHHKIPLTREVIIEFGQKMLALGKDENWAFKADYWRRMHDAVRAQWIKDTSVKQKKGGPLAKAWAEGYRMGIADERISEANIGIAGFNAKVESDRQNPYKTPQPKQEQRCEYCDGTGDVHDQPGEWRGVCVCEAGAKQEQGEPVAIVVARQYDDGSHAGNQLEWRGRNEANDFPEGTAFYTTPPQQQRTWVGLTDEETDHLFNMYERSSFGLVHAVEAKLKEKNT